MPKRTDIKSILIIGAGPIVIGQACEFDYSGTQACKALKEEGYRIILVNSNPATIMTDPDLADATYIEPITPEIVAKIIEKERPDALLPTMGGQTALNTALALERMGVLERFNVEMIGANAKAIDKAEDRSLFRTAMEKLGLETAKSMLANATALKQQYRTEYEVERANLKAQLESAKQSQETIDQELNALHQAWLQAEHQRKQRYIDHAMSCAAQALDIIGLPAIIRPSFTLGGTGGGIAYNRSQFYEIVASGLAASPTTEVLIEESIVGWKEYEMEVVRDKSDNAIIVCSIENIDPMGVHTGDSITVAPALTLTDKEYQLMRQASIAVLREIGVETGGSNVQFAVNPKNGRMIVIEMNPRVSRSSALASKATGFPIAKVAAKLAIGYSLDELKNEITGGVIPASFEPSIDYIVTKIPRFTFEKFPHTPNLLGTSMKSVGEAMAIGRTFQESLQKALRSLETGLSGLDDIVLTVAEDETHKDALRAALATPTPDRIRLVAQAFREGIELSEIHHLTHIDPWFLEQIKDIIAVEEKLKLCGLPSDKANLLRIKAMGFSDLRLATLTGSSEDAVRDYRLNLGVKPIYKRVDSCAAEFASTTAYIYSSYEENVINSSALPIDSCEAKISDRKKVVILGGGPNRIGQGIEFDYCCCQAAFALKEMQVEAIMVNCNPETVSTDYDTSDRLYFEPLTFEDVMAIIQLEQSAGELLGVIVQFGGQTPLKLANSLKEAGIPILGTSPDSINLAEDRDKFKQLLQSLNLNQPQNGIANSLANISEIVQSIGFPLVVRPSYVLGGRAMQIVKNQTDLENYISKQLPQLISEDIKARYPNDNKAQLDNLLANYPLLFDHYLAGAVELDVDCLADGEDVAVVGIMQHIEEAGIHSGDSACSLPTYSISDNMLEQIRKQSIDLAKALNVRGLMNAQYAVYNDKLYVLEVNPRASRTVPFVAKAIGKPLGKIATRVMSGEKLLDAYAPYGGREDSARLKHIAIKEAVFPFARFPEDDILLGPEMRSTGEVMGIDYTYPIAFAKAQLAAGVELPSKGTVFISIRDDDKAECLEPMRILSELGFTILATKGTQAFLNQNNIPASPINKVMEGHPHIEDAINKKQVQMVINTTDSRRTISDSKRIRRASLNNNLAYFTTMSATKAAVMAIKALSTESLEVRSLQSYFN